MTARTDGLQAQLLRREYAARLRVLEPRLRALQAKAAREAAAKTSEPVDLARAAGRAALQEHRSAPGFDRARLVECADMHQLRRSGWRPTPDGRWRSPDGRALLEFSSAVAAAKAGSRRRL